MNSEPPREELLSRLDTVSNHLVMGFAEGIQRTLRTCITCQHYDEPRNICNKYGGNPPPRIIAFGCDGYEQAPPF